MSFGDYVIMVVLPIYFFYRQVKSEKTTFKEIPRRKQINIAIRSALMLPLTFVVIIAIDGFTGWH